jgi:hypothetical protein
MFGQPENNPKNLRVIKTARTLRAINTAAKQGLRPLLKPVDPSPDITEMVAVLQHRETGEIRLSGDMREDFGSEYEMVLPYRDYYPYKFPAPYAAYLVPADLKEGESVWLEDVIEDIVAVYGNQGWQPRLESGEAVWENGDFRILFDPEKDAPQYVG